MKRLPINNQVKGADIIIMDAVVVFVYVLMVILAV